MIDLVALLFSGGEVDVLDLSLWDVRKRPEGAPDDAATLLSHFTDLPRHGTVLGAAGHISGAADAQWVLDQGVDLAYIGKAAITDHRFARNAIEDPAYRAPEFPVSRDHLHAERLGEPFVEYFSANWPKLVR